MLTSGAERPLDTSRLLAIDVEAELRKLAEAQLEGVWQLPAEMVRTLLRGGARRVRAEVRRSSFTVRCDRPSLAPELVRHLASLRTRGASAAARHRALIALEQAGALALIAVAGLGAEADMDETGTRIEVRGLRLPTERARSFLEGACRFAPAALVIDDHPAARGFDGALAEVELAPPLAGRLAIPVRGEVARVWLLLDGVAGAHLTLPGGPCFEAAVEMRDRVGPLPGAAAMREAAAPLIPALAEQAHRLALAAGARIRERSESEQRRIRQLLLTTAGDGRHEAEAFALRIFRAVEGARADERWLSLRDIAALAAGSRAPLSTLDPGQDPSAFLLPPTPILVLDAPERSRLGTLLGVRFIPPARRPTAFPLRRLLHTAYERAANGLRALAHRTRHPQRRQAVPLERLTPAERGLLASLRSRVGSGGEREVVAIVDGTGPVRRTRGPRWWLPRANPLVMACRDAVARDPAWAYPVCLALLEGVEASPGPARALWWNRRPEGERRDARATFDGRARPV